jgi:hypothetical protein
MKIRFGYMEYADETKEFSLLNYKNLQATVADRVSAVTINDK